MTSSLVKVGSTRTTKAFGASPFVTCGTPKTAQSLMRLLVNKRASNSAGAT